MQLTSVFRFEHNTETHRVKAFLNLKLIEEGVELLSFRQKITENDLIAAFDAEGFDPCYIDHTKAKKFIEDCLVFDLEPIAQLTQISPEAEIAEIIHARFDITASTDKLNAFLEIFPSFGGQLVSIQEVKAKLSEMNIVFGINHEMIELLVSEGDCPPTNIATGIPPESSKPAHFISYVDGLLPFELLSDEEEEAFFDLFSLKKLPYIKADVPIMRLVPKYDGVDGTDIFGNSIEPESYPEITFANDLKGVKFDELDPNLLISAREGKPILHRYGMSIVPYNEINLEGLGPKNIEFEGALIINGDLQNGMNVKVTGDVAVNGTIGIAHVEASGNILTSAGIIGTNDAKEILNKQVSIVCQGDVKAKFIENANITTAKSVFCENAIISSNINAGGSIIVGQRGIKSGLIRGGHLIAFNRIVAGIIGSDNGLPTHVQVGVDLFTENKKAIVKKRYDEVLLEKQKLDQLIKLIFTQPERGKNGIMQRVKVSREALLSKIDELRDNYQSIEANIHGLAKAKVIIYETLHYGTIVSIGTRVKEFKQEIYNSVLYYGSDGDINIGSLAINK